jgi:hypothetical protein
MARTSGQAAGSTPWSAAITGGGVKQSTLSNGTGNRLLRRFAARVFMVALVVLTPVVAIAAIEGDTVILQGLDKVTARVWTFEAKIGQPVRFGTLEIYPRYCERTPPEEPPESKAFFDIYEARPGEQRADLFHGWMFASSPALNAVEHPVYDVWLIDCKQSQPVTAPPAEAEPKR